MRNIKVLLIISTFIYLFLATPAHADGIIVPEPPPGPFPKPVPISQLSIKYHHVEVTIDDQVAITRVDQVFSNPNSWAIEGAYFFPIPSQAAVDEFTLWVDGKPVKGEILESGQARKIYEQIVSQMKDPALLEYADQKVVRANVFPIPARGERRVELEYTEILPVENGLVRYIYPLNTEKFSTRPLEEVSIRVNIKASAPIRAIYSPSHLIEINREDNHHVIVSYAENNVKPERDFNMYYSKGENQAFHLQTFRDSNDKQNSDGFFLLLLAPQPNTASEPIPKDVILVLDRSGSMDGEKFRQAQKALSYILQQLKPEDRFNIIAFSTGLERYAPEMRPQTEWDQALDWVNKLSALGSTDINRALLEAAMMSSPERPSYLIFLTDGLPTEGVVNTQMILRNLVEVAHENLRLFAFGVGYDVDTFLLESLAENHHGASTYVLPGEPLDEIVSTFYAKISSPVLTSLNLDFGDLWVYDVFPSPLPDLFAGSQIVVLGRYRQGGITEVALSGNVNSENQIFRFPDQIFQDTSSPKDSLDFIPRLWATRKIGHLLKQIHLQGPDEESIDQVVKLSIRYGIVTPYTSYLVAEPMPLGSDNQDRIVEEELAEMESALEAPSYGRDAVEKAAKQGAMQDADIVSIPSEDVLEMVRIVGARTFMLGDGVWIDTAYDPYEMKTTKVAFLSDDYFALLENHPDLGAAFSLGNRVIAFANGVAYEVVASDSQVDPLDILPNTSIIAEEHVLSPTITHDDALLEKPISTPNHANPDMVKCLGGALPILLFPFGLVVVYEVAYLNKKTGC